MTKLSMTYRNALFEKYAPLRFQGPLTNLSNR